MDGRFNGPSVRDRTGEADLYGKAILAIALIAGAVAPGVASEPDESATPSCDRECLKGFSELYFAALAKHDPSGLPVTASVKFTENGRMLTLGDGFWKTAGKAGYRLEIFDPQTGGIGVETVVQEKGQPVACLLRLKIVDHKIAEVESILARKADAGAVFAPENMMTPPPLYTRVLWPAERNSRLELMAATDAYFRAMETQGTPNYVPAPLLPDTNRIANGSLTNNVPAAPDRSARLRTSSAAAGPAARVGTTGAIRWSISSAAWYWPLRATNRKSIRRRAAPMPRRPPHRLTPSSANRRKPAVAVRGLFLLGQWRQDPRNPRGDPAHHHARFSDGLGLIDVIRKPRSTHDVSGNDESVVCTSQPTKPNHPDSHVIGNPGDWKALSYCVLAGSVAGAAAGAAAAAAALCAARYLYCTDCAEFGKTWKRVLKRQPLRS